MKCAIKGKCTVCYATGKKGKDYLLKLDVSPIPPLNRV